MTPLILAANPSPFAGEADAPRWDAPRWDAPCWDVAELARVLGADVSYPPPKGAGYHVARVLEEKTASDVRQAWAAFGRRGTTSVYVSLSEKAGLPLALIAQSGRGKGGRVPHVLIAHHLTSPKKRALQARTGCLHYFDRIVVLCQAQARYLTEEAGVSADRVFFIHDKVDHHFWTSGSREIAETDGPIVAVGREKRDYQTLIEAVRPLTNRPVVLVASSPWAREGGNSGAGEKGSVPEHVHFVGGLSWTELRDLYRRASVVVVPLQAGTDYAAGVNAVLEAMAVSKPLVVTNTPGIADYVSDGETCRVVPPGDPLVLRAALDELRQNPKNAARLGANARRLIENGRNLDAYVQAVRTVVCGVAPC